VNNEEKKDLIYNWLVENQLYYYVSPLNGKEIQEYSVILGEKIPDLYQKLRDLDIVPESSYNAFIKMVEFQLNVGIDIGLRG
jgi:hypothetical protein